MRHSKFPSIPDATGAGDKKSTRHSKIIGDFGELLVANLLSRSGIEVAVVDHTGIDLIAKHPLYSQPLGISVKSRTRGPRKGRASKREAVTIFSNEHQLQLTEGACKTFRCQPYIAIYAECEKEGDLYITSLENYKQRHKAGGKQSTWLMSDEKRKGYEQDKGVKHIHIEFSFPGKGLEHQW